MVGAGLLSRESIGHDTKSIYYPAGLRDGMIDIACSYLEHVTRRDIFLFVINSPAARQENIVNKFSPGMSKRQIVRLLSSLVKSGLLSVYRDPGLKVIYDAGPIGNRIIDGKIESVDGFVASIGSNLGTGVDVKSSPGIVSVVTSSMQFTIKIGTWMIMDTDEESIYENKDMILGDGGEKVLVAVYNGCKTIDDISTITAIPARVIKAKLNTLRVLRLVIDANPAVPGVEFSMTESGNNFVARIFKHGKKK
jgi:hypothetical protein